MAEAAAPVAGKKAALPPPPYWEARSALFDKLYEKYQANLAAKPRAPISIHVGSVLVEGTAWETTPGSLVKKLADSEAICKDPVVARVNGEHMWDLTRPLEDSCSLEFFPFDSQEGRYTFWHSAAHVLGIALEKKYHCLLNVGPPTESDFWYDAAMPDPAQVVSSNEFGELSSLALSAAKENKPFQRMEVSKSEALELFSYNKFKVALAAGLGEDETITVYRSGDLVDLCRGPHLPSTGLIKAFEVNQSSSSHSDGSASGESLQRVHALAFPSKDLLKEWKQLLEEALKRDHRKVGQDQELYFFHPHSPGSPFMLPHGFRIYSRMIEFMRVEYQKRGYLEVQAPNIFNSKLWEVSGHWAHYQKNMFIFNCEEQPWALKPMNCPGHCLMFAFRARSYRELPIRYAEFGVLHRNELSGTLSGLTRVRRFQQDDSHIFCRADQIESEIEGVMDLIKYTYGVFGFNFRVELSTMPDDHMGEVALWQQAERQLQNVLDRSGIKWKLNPKDGAFYGPKIDIHVQDALKRFHQCATIQLDFQLPLRFELKYMGSEEAKIETPVMIHRAVFGSLERFLAVLVEHTGGKWPFWLSPRQACVIPVAATYVEYAKKVAEKIQAARFYVDVDDSDKTLQKKIREAMVAQYNYVLVVGQEEADSGCVNVRERDATVPIGKMAVDDLIAKFDQMMKDHK